MGVAHPRSWLGSSSARLLRCATGSTSGSGRGSPRRRQASTSLAFHLHRHWQGTLSRRPPHCGQSRRHIRREPALGPASDTELAPDMARDTRVRTRADSTATIAARACGNVLRTNPVGSVSPTVFATGSDPCTAASTLRPTAVRPVRSRSVVCLANAAAQTPLGLTAGSPPFVPTSAYGQSAGLYLLLTALRIHTCRTVVPVEPCLRLGALPCAGRAPPTPSHHGKGVCSPKHGRVPVVYRFKHTPAISRTWRTPGCDAKATQGHSPWRNPPAW